MGELEHVEPRELRDPQAAQREGGRGAHADGRDRECELTNENGSLILGSVSWSKIGSFNSPALQTLVCVVIVISVV